MAGIAGRQMLSTKLNFVVFNPSSQKNVNAAEPVYSTDVKLSDVELPVDSLSALKRIRFSYNKNSTTIAFSALNYYKQHKLNCYYQLEGSHQATINTTLDHKVRQLELDMKMR